MDVAVRLNAVKFYKLHSFVENEYFDDPALLVNLSEERERQELAAVSPDEIRTAILAKDPQPVRPAKPAKPERRNGVVEVDLHIGELLDTTAGMTNADMLQCQLDKFHAVMQEYRDKAGQKIVFIHGKGEGVLRKEIEKQLKTKYRHCFLPGCLVPRIRFRGHHGDDTEASPVARSPIAISVLQLREIV